MHLLHATLLVLVYHLQNSLLWSAKFQESSHVRLPLLRYELSNVPRGSQLLSQRRATPTKATPMLTRSLSLASSPYREQQEPDSSSKLPHAGAGRMALVVSLCNGTDYKGKPGIVQLMRAGSLACSLRQLRSSISLVANVYGFDKSHHSTLANMGYTVIDHSSVPRSKFALRPLFEYNQAAWGRRWPRGNFVQKRRDGTCTAFKLLAWNLTRYRRVLHADADVFFLSDPAPWLHRHRNLQFAAINEYLGNKTNVARERGYDGLNTHLMLLTPSRAVVSILLANAVTGNFIPYTNSEQDVVESIFSSHVRYPDFPAHLHGFGNLCGATCHVSDARHLARLAVCNATCRDVSTENCHLGRTDDNEILHLSSPRLRPGSTRTRQKIK